MPIRLIRTGGLPTRVADAQSLREIGLAANAAVQRRVFVRGRDINDRRFKPYSPSYAARKRRRGEQVSPVNLTDTGRLRRSIHVIYASPNAVALTIRGERAAIARYLQARRAFWGASPQDRRFIAKAAGRATRGAIRRSVRRV